MGCSNSKNQVEVIIVFFINFYFDIQNVQELSAPVEPPTPDVYSANGVQKLSQRIDNGEKFLDGLIKFLQSRAEIESSYSKRKGHCLFNLLDKNENKPRFQIMKFIDLNNLIFKHSSFNSNIQHLAYK